MAKKTSTILIFLILIFAIGMTVLAFNRGANIGRASDMPGGSINHKEINNSIDRMSLEEKLNQIMVLSIDYVWENGKRQDFTRVTEDTRKFLEDYQPGGLILFKNNMKDYTQTQKLTSDIQSVAKNHKFFISTDEEGGRVSMIPAKNKIGTAKSIGDTNDPKNAYKAGDTIGRELKELGINWDYAPVMDVNTNPNNPIIGDRAFSNDEKKVGEFGVQYIKGLQNNGVLATAKHFPGHGDTDADSHKGLVRVNHDLGRIEKIELYPFKEAIKNGVNSIMVGHIIVPALHDNKTPASLSKPIVTDLLKDTLGFKGVVTTDAMDMGAIKDNYEINSAVKAAINAGNDVILMPLKIEPGKDISSYDNLIKYLVNEVKIGNIKEERINDAVSRILTAKSRI